MVPVVKPEMTASVAAVVPDSVVVPAVDRFAPVVVAVDPSLKAPA